MGGVWLLFLGGGLFVFFFLSQGLALKSCLITYARLTAGSQSDHSAGIRLGEKAGASLEMK